MGPFFGTVPPLNLEEVFANHSSNHQPIIVIIEAGTDPLEQIIKLFEGL
jgi:hypothetical protein